MSLRSTSRSRAESIADLYDAHVHEVYRFVHRRCQDEQLSQDITQETFLKVLRGSIHPDDVTVGWLVTVARNHLFDTLRRQEQYEDKLRLMMGGASQTQPIDVAERLRIEGALQQLSLNYRLVLTLHYVDGHSVPAIAKRLGRSLKSVEALVTRARRAFRAELEAGGGPTHGH